MSLSARSINSRNRLILLVVCAALLAAISWYVFSPAEEIVAPPLPVADVSETENTIPTEIVPEFDLVRISRGGTGVIAGRMEPGAKVELYANGRKVSEVIANEDGEWVIILDEPLDAGSVELNLKAVNQNNNKPSEAKEVVVVSVPERDTESFVERAQNGVVAVLSPKDGKGASTVLQKPGVAAYAEVGESLSVDTVDFGAGGGVIFTGRSLPRVEVRLYLDGRFIGDTKADDAGRWTVAMAEADGDLTPGEHMVRVDQTVSEGRVQLRIEQPFVAGQPIDPTLAENGVLVRPGNTLWQIARQLYGSGVRYTLIFGENSEKIADPDLIYPGQLFRLPPKK